MPCCEIRCMSQVSAKSVTHPSKHTVPAGTEEGLSLMLHSSTAQHAAKACQSCWQEGTALCMSIH